jgi:hypothetical protein
VLVATGGVVAASLVVAALAQVMSGSSTASVGDAARVVATAPIQPPTPTPTQTQTQTSTPQRVVRATLVKRVPKPAKPDAKALLLAKQAEEAARLAATKPVRVASFNVLGASHTRGKHGRPGYADGVTRARKAADLISSLDLDVYGAQEFEPTQQDAVARKLPGFDIFPGRSRSFIEGTNSIAWRTERFRAVRTETVGIPYFGGGHVQMPYVLLEDVATGQKIWFANFHNPADVHGPAKKWRNTATAIEADLAKRLSADGTPVIMTGDFNDRAEFFCSFTSQAPFMKSASGATGGPPCNVPRGASVDWVLGSSVVDFAHYQAVDGGVVDDITDHPVIVAEATFTRP